jgi:hypothetical protein
MNCYETKFRVSEVGLNWKINIFETTYSQGITEQFFVENQSLHNEKLTEGMTRHFKQCKKDDRWVGAPSYIETPYDCDRFNAGGKLYGSILLPYTIIYYFDPTPENPHPEPIVKTGDLIAKLGDIFPTQSDSLNYFPFPIPVFEPWDDEDPFFPRAWKIWDFNNQLYPPSQSISLGDWDADTGNYRELYVAELAGEKTSYMTGGVRTTFGEIVGDVTFTSHIK